MFRNRNVYDKIDYDEQEILKEIERATHQKEMAIQIQKQYNFEIPFYVLTEIPKQNENLYALIGLAVLCNRISRENADYLIETIKDKLLKIA